MAASRRGLLEPALSLSKKCLKVRQESFFRSSIAREVLEKPKGQLLIFFYIMSLQPESLPDTWWLGEVGLWARMMGPQSRRRHWEVRTEDGQLGLFGSSLNVQIPREREQSLSVF